MSDLLLRLNPNGLSVREYVKKYKDKIYWRGHLPDSVFTDVRVMSRLEREYPKLFEEVVSDWESRKYYPSRLLENA